MHACRSTLEDPTAAALALAAVATAPTAVAGIPSLPTVPVALSEAPADDAAAPVHFARFGAVSINAAGQVYFGATLGGPSVTASDDSAAFVGSPSGGLGQLAREGRAAPGGAGGPPMVFGDILDTGPLAPDGRAIFTAEVRSPAAGSGVAGGYQTVAGSPGDLRLVHRHAPGEAILGHRVLNTGPRAVLSPQGSHHLIFWDGAAEAEVPTPGAVYQPTMNGSGRIAFTAFDGDGRPPGLYAGPAGDFRPVAVRGDAAPGLPAGHAFDLVLDASQNDAGQLTFLAAARPDAAGSYTWGLWAGQPGDLRLLARDGERPPGLPAGYRFERVLFDIDSPQTPPLSAAGHVAFRGSYEDDASDDRGTGAWLGRPADGPARLLARRGDVVPALTPEGDPTSVVLDYIQPDGLRVNAAGDVVIRVDSTAAGDPRSGDTLLAVPGGGAARLIARVGSPFEVAPGDVRLVSDLYVAVGSGGQDGRASAFNDAGQFVYRLGFADGTSGVFLTAIPEPGAASAGVAAAGASLFRRRRRRARLRRHPAG